VEWHDLRRTCGCRLLQDKGFTMVQVSKWLGHASVRVTEKHYAFLYVDDLERALAEGAKKLHRHSEK
jgi:integrase/recombinase XerD